MNEPAFIVQFPHPGGEHRPKTDVMPWNVGSHRRKFMVADGHYRDSGGSSAYGKIVFWGEWEAQSRVVRRWSRQDALPTVLHEPFLGEPPEADFYQNTDPWVFGECFHYSNCKQVTNKARTITAMQRLTVGSLILFGSGVEDHFVLDTALVISRSQGSYMPANHDLDVSDEFQRATIDPLIPPDDAVDPLPLTLYDGATPEQPLEGMFSFTPCLPYDDDGPRFARPHIELPGIINPQSKQSASGAKSPRTIGEVRDAWKRVVAQVEAQDLLLGTNLQLSANGQNRG